MSVYKTIGICLNLLLQIARWSAIYGLMLLTGHLLRLSTNWSLMDIYIGMVVFCIGFTGDRLLFAIRSGFNVKTWALLSDYVCLALSYKMMSLLSGISNETFWQYFVLAIVSMIGLDVLLQRYIGWLFKHKRSLFKLFSHNTFVVDDRLIHISEYELDGTFSTHMQILETKAGVSNEL